MKPTFSNSNDFKKLCFRDRLVWTKALTEEIKLRFKLPSASIAKGNTYDVAQIDKTF